MILFCDVERPLRWRPVTAFNRWFGRVVMTASETQNVAGERIGALNRLFPHVYTIRLAFKALKRRSRAGYYTSSGHCSAPCSYSDLVTRRSAPDRLWNTAT